MTKLADLKTHPIEGIARMGNVPFSVPLYSQINETLWTGGCPDGEVPEDFQFIVCLYPWQAYQLHDHQVFVQAKLLDHGQAPDAGTLKALARTVNVFRAIGPTLVHCQAGLNRSGLVAAFALMQAGMPAAEAIKLLREKRSPAVLCNQAFENWLLGYGKPKLEVESFE